VVVSECTRARGKLKSSIVQTASHHLVSKLFITSASLISIATLPAYAEMQAPAANALPTGGQLVAGQAAVSSAGNVMTVQQATQRAVLNWQSFDIGSQATVNFNQPNSSAVALNRIVGNSASQIYGRLNANGQVFLFNPQGTYFAPGSEVNVGGLLSSTMHINDNDFMAGNYKLSNPGGGIIETLGKISADSIALVGNNINNSGNLIATTVSLVSGNQVAVDISGNNLIRARIEDPALTASITNSGSIIATNVTMTTGQAKNALASVVNNSGIINATSLTQKGGEIFLEGNTVSNSGTIDASGATGGGSIMLMGDMQNGLVNVGGTLKAEALPSPFGIGAGGESADGGFIETSAARVKVANNVHISTLASNGNAGTWLIDPHDFTIAASGGDISGSTLIAQLAGGNVSILSSQGSTISGHGDINVNDAVSWIANTLTLTAARDININAVMTATGNSKLTMKTATANGADGTVTGGVVKVGMNSAGFTGRVDFGNRSGSDILKINNEDYFVINSLGVQNSNSGSDLQGIQGNLTRRYALGSNIDATATAGWNDAGVQEGFNPIGSNINTNPFTGNLEGLGHSITNLTINRLIEDVGLFGSVNHGNISNLQLSNANVTGIKNVGALVGSNTNGTVRNSYAGGSVAGSNSSVGGLVGINTNGTVSNSYAIANVTGLEHVGGLVGTNDGSVSNSYAGGSVTGYSNVGGLVGINSNSALAASVSNSYATGSVTGNSYVGGLVGANYYLVENSYATGSVTGATNVGGLVGYLSGGTYGAAVNNSFWDTQTSHQTTSAGGTGKPTAQMKQASTFSGAWDANVWNLSDGAYPTLKNMPSAGGSCDAIYTACWIAGTGGSWLDAFNWFHNYIPTSTDKVFIDVASSLATINLSGLTSNLSLVSLTSNESFTFNNAGHSLSISGNTNFSNNTLFTLDNGTVAFNGTTNLYDLALNGGTLDGSGTVNVNHSFSQTATSTINRTGAMTIVQAIGSLAFKAANVGELHLTAGSGDVTLGNINSSGSITINAGGGIAIATGKSVSSHGAIVLDADSNADGSGNIVANSGSSLLSNGGNITLSGGADPATGAARGTSSDHVGIRLVSASIDADGGNILMRGWGWDDSTAQNAQGIDIGAGSHILTSGTGNITLNGKGGSDSTGLTGHYNYGIQMNGVGTNGGASIVAANGNINITAVAGNGLHWNEGFFASDGAWVKTTGTGQIQLSGTGGSGTDADGRNYGVYLFGSSNAGVHTVIEGGGGVDITGIAGSGGNDNNGIYMSDLGGGAIVRAIGSGTVSMHATGSGDRGLYLSGHAQIVASTTGNNIKIETNGFYNNVGASVFDASGGRWLVWSSNANPFDASSGDFRNGLSYNFKQYNFTNINQAVLGSGNGFLYTLAPTVTPVLTGTVSKIYNGDDVATLAASNYTTTGTVDGDSVTLNTPSTGTYDDKNVTGSQTVNVSGIGIDAASNGSATVYGYGVTNSVSGAIGNITTKDITAVTGISAANKTYNGNTDATLNTSGAGFTGIVSGEDLNVGTATGTFNSKNVLTANTVNISDITLADKGTNLASNYNLTSSTASASANIIAKDITAVTGISAANKTYNGNTDATLNTSGAGFTGIVSGEDLNVGTATGTFNSKNVLTANTVNISDITLADKGTNLASNYNLTSSTASASANIIAKDISVSGVTGIDKEFDTTDVATVNVIDDRVLGDVLAYTNTATFDNADVANNKTVTVSAISLTGGADMGNYNLLLPSLPITTTANITGTQPVDNTTPEVKQELNNVVNATLIELDNTSTPPENNDSPPSEQTDGETAPVNPDAPVVTTTVQLLLLNPDKVAEVVTQEVPKGKVLTCSSN
jgi:filamentous hemagglutinin family protein